MRNSEYFDSTVRLEFSKYTVKRFIFPDMKIRFNQRQDGFLCSTYLIYCLLLRNLRQL